MHLETARLLIRDYVPDDGKSVHQYASNETVCRYTMWGPNTEHQTKDYIEQVIAAQGQNPRLSYELAVILKEEEQLIGGCGLVLNTPNGEIGYCFHPAYWGRGYAAEAARAMLQFGFTEHHLHRIYATCRPGNVASANVMRRIGMKQEGHLREHLWFKGQYHDSYLFSILEHEFHG
ncbi:GNAT family N-acetyltransferase [Paenibacillus sp. P96]|uniref:GNAT family N-acetyltransferase n=1 Tax=Paenibacillus zeirhizosphaerae TaxID=2987519 RepID=A0ABT9FSC9_9BACL|nr:GNAT family protein [Paenibacillus sp. P96]MDP4097641.1 GNAT family N-acetyltransferase [Paenibacillus sp. P96]